MLHIHYTQSGISMVAAKIAPQRDSHGSHADEEQLRLGRQWWCCWGFSGTMTIYITLYIASNAPLSWKPFHHTKAQQCCCSGPLRMQCSLIKLPRQFHQIEDQLFCCCWESSAIQGPVMLFSTTHECSNAGVAVFGLHITAPKTAIPRINDTTATSEIYLSYKGQ